MSKDFEKLKQRYEGNWFDFTDEESAHSHAAIEKLRDVQWAQKLVQKVASAPQIFQWLRNNLDKKSEPEWLEKWASYDDFRSDFFEVRFAEEIHQRGIEAQYEYQTIGKSSVDFEIKSNEKSFRIELLCTLQTEHMTKATEVNEDSVRGVTADSAEELRKVQGKIVRKVAKEVGENHIPHKFPEPEEDCYNVIIADTRGFEGGNQLWASDRVQLLWGAKELLRRGGREEFMYWVKGSPMSGLFDKDKPGPEAKLFRERIHLLGLVSEETFGPGELVKQLRFYPNPYLEDSQLALESFPLKIEDSNKA